MTRIAIISDIHGNLPALNAAIRDMSRLEIDRVIVDGDLVGRGPQSREILDVVTAKGWDVVKGNHEEFWAQCGQGDTPQDWADNWWKPTRMQIKQLEPGWFAWMDTLPTQIVIALPDAPTVQIVHGSPRQINEGLYPHPSEAYLLDALDGTPHSVVVGAHTHQPMDRTVGAYHVLNCGSVGAPFNENHAAQYLLLDLRDGEWHPEFRQVPYDHQAALRHWHTSGYYASGVAAQIFAYELETATFHFWHYVRYCEVNNLSYNKPASFVRYRDEFPAYRQYCSQRDLPLHKNSSLIQYRDSQRQPPAATNRD